MAKKLHLWLVFLIFLNGFVSMALELLVLRQLAFFVGSSAVITSIIMGTFMGFMSLGYFLGTRGKFSAGRARRILAGSFLTISAFAVFGASFPFVSKYFELLYQLGVTSGVVQTFIFSFLFLSVGPFLFGYNTTLLSRILHKYNTNYAGNIMAWDTIGSVAASVATTLALMPFIGVNHTVMFIVALALTGALITRARPYVFVVGGLILAGCVMINSDRVQEKYFGIIVNNANSTISVQGDDSVRVLYMNGLPMSVYYPQYAAGAEYINYINENFIYNMPRDRRRKILVLGAGGFTAGLNDDFNEYTFVDIEARLRDISESHFLRSKLTPNKQFVVRDASQYLKNTPEKYDLIILDVYSNSYQIPENLITAEFMSRIKSRVADDGIIIMNMVTSASFRDTYTRVFDNTFHRVFPYNTQRQVMGTANPWVAGDEISNVLYIFYNRKNSGRIYTINKTPVIYDVY